MSSIKYLSNIILQLYPFFLRQPLAPSIIDVYKKVRET